MKRTTMQLVAKGFRVQDLTQKSWFLNKKSVEALTNTFQAACTVSLRTPSWYLTCLASTKFRQANNTLALATRVGGGGMAHAG